MKPYEAPEIQEKLNIIKDAVLSVVPDTEAVYLFGSYAYGVPHEYSDLDVYVVVPDSEKRRQITIEVEIFDALTDKLLFPIDLMVQYSGVFERNKNTSATIAKTIARNGVKLHG
jgi:predicted nucleotidyltransferase